MTNRRDETGNEPIRLPIPQQALGTSNRPSPPVPAVRANVVIPPPPGRRLLDRLRDAIRMRHYSPRTEKAYVHWVRRYILFHGKRHPAEMGAAEVSEFLGSLAVRSKVAASTQNQALCALLFRYRDVLQVNLPWLDDMIRAKRPERLPVVFTREEVLRILDRLAAVVRLMTTLVYGSGLRLLECCRLRIKDVDFGNHHLIVRRGKGDKDRATLLPATIEPDLERQISATDCRTPASGPSQTAPHPIRPPRQLSGTIHFGRTEGTMTRTVCETSTSRHPASQHICIQGPARRITR